MLCNYGPPTSPGSIPGYLQYGVRGRGSSANHPPTPSSLRYQSLHTIHTTLLQGYLHSRKDAYIPTHNNKQQSYNTVIHKITNVPVVIWRLYLMVLRRATSIQGALEEVGPENRDFFGPWKGNERSECHLGPKKLRFSGTFIVSKGGGGIWGHRRGVRTR